MDSSDNRRSVRLVPNESLSIPVFPVPNSLDQSNQTRRISLSNSNLDGNGAGRRISQRRYQPREERQKSEGTNDLADFLKDSGPPELSSPSKGQAFNPARISNDHMSSPVFSNPVFSDNSNQTRRISLSNSNIDGNGAGRRVAQRRYQPREERQKSEGTNDLADFLKESGPPAEPPPSKSQTTANHKRHITNTSSLPSSNSNLVTFEANDPGNPQNWPAWRKWLVVLALTLANFMCIWIASGYTTAQEEFQKSYHVSKEVSVLPLTLYVLSLGLGPMIMAPLSEYFGRSPVYLISFGAPFLLLLGTALIDDGNLGGFLVLRILTGLLCSGTIANIGGTIADMWDYHHTSFPLSIYNLTSAGASSSGYFVFSFIAQTHGLHGVLWGLTGFCGGFFLLLCVVLYGNETRHSVLLRRRAETLRKETGKIDLEVASDMQKEPPKQLMKNSLLRPFHFLFTEPVIIFCAAYNGYLFGLTFLFNGAFYQIFGPDGYGFSTRGVGLANLGVIVGVIFGAVTHLWQERYYFRQLAKSKGEIIPEARVQLGMVAAVVFPVSLFCFAWTTFTFVHWIVPIIFSAFYGWSFYTLILMTMMYVEDTYMNYAASALAGVTFARNMFGGVFPLFGRQMYTNLGYQWAGCLLGFLALLLMPIPFILQRYGRSLRKKSPWARGHMDDLEDDEIAEFDGRKTSGS